VRAVVQRVARASVVVERRTVGEIGPGLLVLLGVADGDQDRDAETLADKIVGLRIFRDDGGAMNLAVGDVGGAVLVVSQFTLVADLRKGRRPSFIGAGAPSEAERLVAAVASRIESAGIPVATGEFGAFMEVTLVNDGPVTIVLDVEDGRVR
jgi:D-tyrosyl-tRNA(Tyr) deacylase